MSDRSPVDVPNRTAPDVDTPRIHVVVHGMHRSGTSLVARIVGLLGVSLGDPGELLGPGDDNRAGYFENREIKTLNDVILADLGGSWDRPPRLDRGWEHDPALDVRRTEAAAVLAHAFPVGSGDGRPVGFKDPRVSLLLPFWRTVTTVEHSIVLVRHPDEVAASLAARRFRVDPDAAAGLWLRHLFAALAADPDALVVRHGDPFDDLDALAARIVGALGLPRPDPTVMDQIRAHVDPRLFHQRATDSETVATSPLERLARTVWNDGDLALDALDDDVVAAIAMGHLHPAGDADVIAQARAQASSFKSQLKARNAQVRALERKLASLVTAETSGPSGTGDGDGTGPHLELPPELWVTPDTRRRLEQRLDGFDPRHLALVAPAVDLAAGTSVTSDSARRALSPPTLRPVMDDVVEGAAAARSTDAVTVAGPTAVAVTSGLDVLEDRSLAAHRVWLTGTVADASPEGRPPFPTAPIVVFLGTEADDDIDDISRGWVNDLIRLGVEARLAVPAPPPGLHLSAPCAPSIATLDALCPDVVIALDDGALELTQGWGPDRSVAIARLSQDSVDRVSVDPDGPVTDPARATVGRRSTARDIQALVARLASGPWITRPATPHTPIPEDDVEPVVPSTRTFAVLPDVPGVRSGAGQVMREALTEFAETMRRPLDVLSGVRALRSAGLFTTDTVLTAASSRNPLTDRIVEVRARAGLETICWVDGTDIVADRDAPDGVARLEHPAQERVETCGRALVPSPAVARHLQARGVRSVVAPVALPSRLLTRLATLPIPQGSRTPVFGWLIDPAGAAPPPSTEAIITAMHRLLDQVPEARLEIVAPRTWTHDASTAHPRITISSVTPPTSTLARWTAQVWSPSSRQVRVLGGFGPLVEAAAAGLPTVMTHADAAHSGLLTDPSLLVRDRLDDTEWFDRFSSLCVPEVRAIASTRGRVLASGRLGLSGRTALARAILSLSEAA